MFTERPLTSTTPWAMSPCAGSASVNVTKPKPRPVGFSRSFIICTSVIVPYRPHAVRITSSDIV
eukprot:2974960-Prymnesium_polylepis.1